MGMAHERRSGAGGRGGAARAHLFTIWFLAIFPSVSTSHFAYPSRLAHVWRRGEWEGAKSASSAQKQQS
jgi:hypothetical protein